MTLKALSGQAVIALGTAVLLSACGWFGGDASDGAKSFTLESAGVDLVNAQVAIACAQDEYLTCRTADSSGEFVVMMLPAADIEATFDRVCTSLAGETSNPDPASLGGMKVVTDRTSFLVVGGAGLTMPTSVDPAAIQKIVGGEVISMAEICN